jgi:hypothetical protein
MTLPLIGLVYYADDPEQRVFRKVYPMPGDPANVLDQPRWITEGCDPSRKAVLRKVWSESEIALAPATGAA